MRLWWIRHGQMDVRVTRATDRRAIDRMFNQEQESGLSARGRGEAERVGKWLISREIEAVYASPLMRAKETAEIVAGALSMKARIHPGIGELRTGRLKDDARAARWLDRIGGSSLPPRMKAALIAPALIPLYYHAWRNHLTVGGESPEELESRVRGFITELRAAHPRDANVAIVSHGYLTFTFANLIANGARDRLRIWRRPYIANGGITIIEADGDALRLVSYGDSAHLR